MITQLSTLLCSYYGTDPFINDETKMSFAHIKLNKIKEEGGFSTFSVQSPDFNNEREWQEIAELVLNRTTGTYTFSPRNAWINFKFIPPHIFEMDKKEMEVLLSKKFSGYGYGAWTGRIAAMIRKIHPRE